MLTCIACSKQKLHDAADDTPRETPSTKAAAKSLTAQIKDVALKLSGAYRQCKVGVPAISTSYRSKPHRYRSYYDDILEVDGGILDGGNGERKLGEGFSSDYYHPFPTSKASSSSTSSTPAWDFARASEPGKFIKHLETWIPGMGLDAAEGNCCGPPMMLEEDREPKEWVAQVEPGVHITFLALPRGGNDLKRIRFSREIFNKLQAQRWWGENYDRIMELYNVQRFSRQALPTPPRSEDERDMPSLSRMGSRRENPCATVPLPTTATTSTSSYYNAKPLAPGCSNEGGYYPTPDPTEQFFHQCHIQNGPPAPSSKGEASLLEASRTTTSSREDASASDMMEVTEWVEEDEPGVYITIRQMSDGTRDLRRVRFSRERFGEVNAKLWWEENRERIHAQYL